MADIRINSLPSTATSFNTDDYIAIDGASAGTRRMLAATLPLTDVTLGGTSGPSVKSTLSARAPRQGLVFDGSGTKATVTVPAFGTGDFTASAWVREDNSFAGTPVVMIGSGTGGFYMEFDANGFPYVAVQGGAGVLRKATTACVVKKLSLITYVKTSGTGIWYVNGIAAGSAADSNNYTAGIAALSDIAPYNLTGYVFPLIYNRALSASEVVALYEAGAPAGADYNSASNTLLNTSTALNTFSTAFATFTGASSTGFTGSDTTASISPRVRFPLSGTLVQGRRYRVKGTATLTAMTAVTLWQSTAYSGVGTIGTVNGAFEFTFTAGASVDSLMFICTTDASVGTHTTVISGLALDTPGLLLAPDAAQAGGGLTWYDTSGNAANITLPASGVSWNVPTSGRQASLALNSTLSNATYGPLITQTTTGGSYGLFISNAVNASFGVDIPVASTIRLRTNSNSEALSFALGTTETARFAVTTGNYLIGTTTDVAAYKLNVYGATSANVIAANGVTPDGTKTGGSFGTALGGTGGATGSYALAGDIAGRFVMNAYGNNFIYEAASMQAEITTGGNTDRNLHVAALDFYTKPTASNSLTRKMRLTGTGNLILSSTGTDSANGKIQLADHTTSAGGIGFGTDVSLYRSNAGYLTLLGTASLASQYFRVGSQNMGYLYFDTTDGYVSTSKAGASLVLRSGNEATALTLDSSQNATFAGKVTAGTWADVVSARLGVATSANSYTATIANNASSGGSYALRLHTTGTASSDYIVVGSSGASAGSIRFLADGAGNFVVNNAAIATTATDGFLYVSTCAGTPTGTPTSYTGRAPIVVDTTNNKLYFYSGGAWRDAGP